jgi:hypothetical protein
MRSTIINSISTVAGNIRGNVVVVAVKSVLCSSLLKAKRSFYSPTPASMAACFAALRNAAEQATAAVRHRGHDSLMQETCGGWQPVGVLSGTVC